MAALFVKLVFERKGGLGKKTAQFLLVGIEIGVFIRRQTNRDFHVLVGCTGKPAAVGHSHRPWAALPAKIPLGAYASAQNVAWRGGQSKGMTGSVHKGSHREYHLKPCAAGIASRRHPDPRRSPDAELHRRRVPDRGRHTWTGRGRSSQVAARHAIDCAEARPSSTSLARSSATGRAATVQPVVAMPAGGA